MMNFLIYWLVYVPLTIFMGMVLTCAICAVGMGIGWVYDVLRGTWRRK